MIIQIEEHKDYFEADFPELPGISYIGRRKTIEESIAELFIQNINNTYLKKLDLSKIEIIKTKEK